jgi:hypothetical protein
LTAAAEGNIVRAMARLVAAPCPLCGASLSVDPRAAEATCARCGEALAVQRRGLFRSPPPPSGDRPVVQVRGLGSVTVVALAVCLGLPLLVMAPAAAVLFLGNTKKSGKTRKPRPPDTMEEACAHGSGRQCFQAGYAYENGSGRPKDVERAMGFYDKACKLEYAEACARLGWAYQQGNGVERDLAEAARLHDLACTLKNATGCNNLGWAYQRGTGIEKNMPRAVALYQQACDMGSALGCNNAGATAADNPAIRDDPAKITGYFEMACNRGHGGGCNTLAERVAKDDPRRSAELYKKACELGVTPACSK